MANILLMYQLAFHFPNKNILAPPSTFNLHCKGKRIIIFFLIIIKMMREKNWLMMILCHFEKVELTMVDISGSDISVLSIVLKQEG